MTLRYVFQVHALWIAAAAPLVSGCVRPLRPYEAFVECRPDDAAPLESLDEAIAVVDADGDGVLTANDLRPGEAIAILSVRGVHFASGLLSQSGFSIHAARQSYLVPVPIVDREAWVMELRANCLPELILNVGFGSENPPADRVREQAYGHVSVFPDIPTLEILGFGDQIREGTMTISHVGPTRVSGHMSGFVGTALVAAIPEMRPTGQQIIINALAFRDILDFGAPPDETN